MVKIISVDIGLFEVLFFPLSGNGVLKVVSCEQIVRITSCDKIPSRYNFLYLKNI